MRRGRFLRKSWRYGLLMVGINWLIRGLRSDIADGVESNSIPERIKYFGMNSAPVAKFTMSRLFSCRA